MEGRKERMKSLQLCNQSPALRIPVIIASHHEDNHLAAYAPPNPRAISDTERLLAKLDEIAVESLRAENFEEKGAQDE
jgi:hypothetical protein